MEHKVTLREQEAKSLEAYFESQNKRFELLKEFLSDGYKVDKELLSVVQVFQDRGLEVYERYTKVQRELASKLKNINVLNSVDNKVIEKNSSVDNKLLNEISNETINSEEISESQVIKRFEVKSVLEDNVSYGACILPTTGTMIIIGKDNEYVKELSRLLENRGLKVVLIDSIIKEENAVKEIIEELARTTTIAGMVAVGNIFNEAGAEERAYDFFITVEYITKYISIYIKENNNLDNPVILFNTFLDGKLAVTGEYDNNIYGAFPGFVKSVAKEFYGKVYVKLIDFEPGMDEKDMVQAFYDEMCCINTRVEVGRTIDGHRHVLKAVLEKTIVTDNKSNLTLDDVILVLGGIHGVTVNCLYELSKKVNCKFVILDTKKILDNYNKDDENIFDLIRKNGNEVYHYSVDVRDKISIASIIKEIEEKIDRITGVVCGLDAFLNQKIYNKDMNYFKFVYETKYNGLNSILENLDKNKLKFLVMFSSILDFYSETNEYIDKYAYYFGKKYPNCKTVAINWGAWTSEIEVGIHYFVNEFLMGLPSKQIMITNDGGYGHLTD